MSHCISVWEPDWKVSVSFITTCFMYVTTGVMNLVVTATGDRFITEKVTKLSENIEHSGVSI